MQSIFGAVCPLCLPHCPHRALGGRWLRGIGEISLSSPGDKCGTSSQSFLWPERARKILLEVACAQQSLSAARGGVSD